ncbi:MAG: patatin-like phospholipase family protein [Paracoccaceae bacterium]
MAPNVRKINLALQGGGAHGAFTWGVLDRLLEDETVEIAGISGTSAGALNGAALKAGLLSGGRAAARENLDWLWGEVMDIADLRFPRWMMGPLAFPEGLARAWAEMAVSPAVDAFTRAFSPYDWPFASDNPLRPIADRFHYHRVCADEGPAFFVAATNVRTGKIRVFSGAEISTDVLLASACLPTIFRAVELRDPVTGKREAYWDGGYTGNPALFPLYAPDLPNDIVIVNINPLVRDALPRRASEIQNRINEISFNSSLLRELRAINFVKELIADGSLTDRRMKDVHVHMIADDDLMNSLDETTKMLALPGLMAELRDAGRRAAGKFLTRDGDKLGVAASVDLERLFN